MSIIRDAKKFFSGRVRDYRCGNCTIAGSSSVVLIISLSILLVGIIS